MYLNLFFFFYPSLSLLVCLFSSQRLCSLVLSSSRVSPTFADCVLLFFVFRSCLVLIPVCFCSVTCLPPSVWISFCKVVTETVLKILAQQNRPFFFFPSRVLEEDFWKYVRSSLCCHKTFSSSNNYLLFEQSDA